MFLMWHIWEYSFYEKFVLRALEKLFESFKGFYVYMKHLISFSDFWKEEFNGHSIKRKGTDHRSNLV